MDLENFDRGNDNKISRQIKAEGLEAFQTPRQVPEQIDINPAIDPVNTTPVARNLQHIESQEGAFKNGYDSDGNKGTYWGATHLEGEQDPDEPVLQTLDAAAAAAAAAVARTERTVDRSGTNSNTTKPILEEILKNNSNGWTGNSSYDSFLHLATSATKDRGCMPDGR